MTNRAHSGLLVGSYEKRWRGVLFRISARKWFVIFPFLTFFGLTVLSPCLEAAGEDWQYVVANEKGERFFYDRGSLTKPAKDVVSVWIKVVRGDASLTRSLTEVNCPAKVIRDMRVITEGQRQPTRFSNDPSEWRPMELDPVTKELHKVLCR